MSTDSLSPISRVQLGPAVENSRCVPHVICGRTTFPHVESTVGKNGLSMNHVPGPGSTSASRQGSRSMSHAVNSPCEIFWATASRSSAHGSPVSRRNLQSRGTLKQEVSRPAAATRRTTSAAGPSSQDNSTTCRSPLARRESGKKPPAGRRTPARNAGDCRFPGSCGHATIGELTVRAHLKAAGTRQSENSSACIAPRESRVITRNPSPGNAICQATGGEGQSRVTSSSNARNEHDENDSSAARRNRRRQFT